MADFRCSILSEGYDYTIPPLLKDIDFWFWKARMTSFIKASDFDMWNVFTNAFDHKPRKDWTEKEKKMFSLNIRAMRILYSAVTENDFEKIRFCSNAKDIWDTLDSMYTSNKCVEVESVDSSCKTTSYASTMHEQWEVDDEEGEIIENFHTVNMDRQEEEDSRKELIIDEHEKSLCEAQDELKVKSSNSSCEIGKNDFQSLHKTIFQPITHSIEKNKSAFNYAGNLCEKKRQIDHLRPPSLKQHNTCIKPHNAYHYIMCNYCCKLGHSSHTCHIRRNVHVRNKYVWVPRRPEKYNANNHGPKYIWVPKCPPSMLCMQNNGQKGTEKMMKKKSRGSRAPIKRLISSQKRTLRTSIAEAIEHNHKEKQWIKGVCFTLRKCYHNVPFNYLEENKKRRISHTHRKIISKPTSYERALHNAKAKYAKTELQRKMQWACKANSLST